MTSIATYSRDMHQQTEKPGALLSWDEHMVIHQRYYLAGQLVQGKRVLEVGCGTGYGLRYLAKRAASIIGGEFSEENRAEAQRLLGETVPIQHLDAHQLPFPPKSFEVILAMAMVYYLDMGRFLGEARRVLAPDGILFFCTSNMDVPGFVPSPYTTRYYSVPELDAMLRSAGFAPRFQGAFPAGDSRYLLRLRACLKTAAKKAIQLLPGGKRFWLNLRQRRQGPTRPLPPELEDSAWPMQKTDDLDPKIKDWRHRVIYVTARLAADP